MSSALIVFAKVPVAGHVKTRLTPALDHEEAADLYRAFLLDALDLYVTLGPDVRLYVAPGVAGLDALKTPEEVAHFKQKGDGLGERMSRAFFESFAADYHRVAIVGTDHPTLPASFIGYAFECLSHPETVTIGPASDGGYYLLGMNRFMPEVFRGMSYSHADVFADTLERITASRASAVVLPEWYDVDTPDQLRRLRADLSVSGNRTRTKQHVEHLAGRHAWLRE